MGCSRGLWPRDVRRAPSSRYDPGGPTALTDGKWGSTEHTDGTWHGFEGADLDAVVDLGSVVEIESVRVGYLSNPDSWILPPKRVEFFLSEDGDSFRSIAAREDAPLTGMSPKNLCDFGWTATGEKARYVRVVATNAGLLPDT